MLQGTGGPVRPRSGGGTPRLAYGPAPRASSRAARPTSSPARWACRATPSRPPRSSCGRSAAGHSRLVGLGRADDRWFTFNAGMGWDADVVAEVEQMRVPRAGAPPRCGTRPPALRQYYRQWRDPQADDRRGAGACSRPPTSGWRSSATPSTWTYLGSRAVHTNPGASFATGLGLFALRSLGVGTVAHVLREILRAGGDPQGRNVVRHDAVRAGQGLVRGPRWPCSSTATTSASAREVRVPLRTRGATRRGLTTTRRRPRSAVHRTAGVTGPENPANRRSVRRFRRTVGLQRARTWGNDAPR